MTRKMKVDLGFANLIAEKQTGEDWLAVYLEDKNGNFLQDLVHIEPGREEEVVKCCIWGDRYDESWTQMYLIPKYDGD